MADSEVESVIASCCLMQSEVLSSISVFLDVIQGQTESLEDATIREDGSIVADGSNTPSTFKTDLGSTGTDTYKDLQIIIINAGQYSGQVRRISAYDGSTKFITVDTAFDFTPAGGDLFYIIHRWTPAVMEETGILQSELASHILALSGTDSILNSEIGSCALEQSTVLSQIESSADLIEPNDAETQSEIASHALQQSEAMSEANSALAERDLDLSLLESSAELIQPEFSNVKSEIASCALEQSEVLSTIDRVVDGIDDIADDLYDSTILRVGTVTATGTTTTFQTNLPEDDDHWNGLYIVMKDTAMNSCQVRRITSFVSVNGVVTVSQPFEVAVDAGDEFYLMSRYLDPTYYENTTSEIASHVLQNSTPLSEAISGLEERDIDLSEVTSEVASHALQNSLASSQVHSEISTHDTDIKGLVNIKATPEFLVVPSGVTRINVEGGITAIQTTIPIYDSAQCEDEGIILCGTELISYTGISDGSLTGCTRGYNSTTPAIHADQAAVYEVVCYPLRLMVYDNEQNMTAPDSAPTLEIVDWAGTQELAPTAMTLISTGLYGYDYLVYSTDAPESKTLRFSVVIDGVTTLRQSTLMMLDKPASKIDMIALIGGGNGEFAVTQDGWYDNDGIFTAWTDVMAGYLRDNTSGSRLDDVLVTAYEVINGTTIRAIIPPGQTVGDSNGNYEMRLDAGTYVFKFYKDQYRFPTDEVTRVIS